MLGTRLVLVRHGHSMAQETGTAGGHDSCSGLSARGRAQVTALAERLSGGDELGTVDALWTSILPRAVETGDLLRPAVGDPPVERTCDLCENHVGEADGMTWEAIRERWPWPDEPGETHRMAPGAETFGELRDRVAGVLDRIARRHAGQTVLVATHGGVIAAAMLRMLRVPRDDHPDRAYFDTDNAALTVFDSNVLPWGSTGRPRWRLERYNDATHLRDVGA